MWRAGTLLALALGLCAADASDEAWTPILEKQGVEVSALERPGNELPVLRARGAIDANLFDVLAVLHDVARQPEWMESCSEARLLQREGRATSVVYNRTSVPWPIADRDAVVRSETRVQADGLAAWMRFRSAPPGLLPEQPGVVRVPRLEGHFALRALERERTHVEYLIDTDPGGSLPLWLRRRSTRELAGNTLLGLRRQVALTRGAYPGFRERWDPLYGHGGDATP